QTHWHDVDSHNHPGSCALNQNLSDTEKLVPATFPASKTPPPRCRPCAETGVVLPSSALHVSPARRTSQVASRRVVGDAAHDQSEGATVRGSIDSVDTGGRKLPRKRQAVGAGGDDPRVEHR